VGCGDGIKGNILLREFAKRLGGGQVVSYFPLDISGTLIDEAVNNALDGIDPGHFFVQPFTSDHRHLKELQLGRGPRLFAVLGNTAGNADERQVMTAISQAMVPGDLVLIEANIGKPDANDPIWRNPARMAFNFAPLATLGVPFDPARMRITLVEGQSIAEGTRSILTSYVEVEIDGKVIDEVKLYFVHYYNQHSLVPAIEREMNVETLWSHSAGDVCLVLGEAAG